MSKMMKKILFGMAVWLFAASFSSCISYEDVQVTNIRNLELKRFSSEDLSISAEVQIVNPNNYQISVTGSKFNISTGGKALGNFVIANKLVLPKDSKDYHELVFDLQMKDLAPNAESTLLQIALFGDGKIEIKVDGYIEAKAFMVKRKFPILFEDEVDLEL